MNKFILLISILLSALTASAGDKIGNGGGAWTCTENSQIKQAYLVDLYEGVTQFDLHLIEPSSQDPMEIVEQINSTLSSRIPQYAARWSAILADVKTRLHFVNAELEVIDDSLYLMRPLGSCSTRWEYTQFANYTNYNDVLIRQDLWQSNALSALDKAGLIWHEVIYRWMREDFKDQNSVRARFIVGVLFSNLPAEIAQKKVAEKLKDSPPPPQSQWICLVRNDYTNKFFYDYGANQLLAKGQTIKACQKEDFAIHCNEYNMQCDQILPNLPNVTCAVRNDYTAKVFTETGRSRLEAEAKARKACSDAEGEVHCEMNIECE
ncbi:MAG TPA: hypothetical protein VN132_04850 [Bdellovibrio sp.]|nr:hypothetical protein [Bdellovibrio sp.]